MFKLLVVSALAVLCVAQKSSDLGAVQYSYNIQREPLVVETTMRPELYLENQPENTWDSTLIPTRETLQIRQPAPLEVSQSGMYSERRDLPSETLEWAAPNLGVGAPLINLPKEGKEVVDIPHANIRLPGNSLENKDLHLNLPTPIVEAPKPIIKEKEVLFKFPQPIFYVPKPVIQHKPIIYKVGHTTRTLTPVVNLRPYLFKVPEAQVSSGKSAYSYPY